MAETQKTQQISESMAASKSKSDLIEKIVFAAVPILFSCIVYLMTALSASNREITVLQSRVAVVVTQDNRAIPPQGTTLDMANIREQLGYRIDQVEREAAVARGIMTLDRERGMAAIAASAANMNAEAAVARGAMRSEAAAARAEIIQRLSILENEFKHLRERSNSR